ELLHDIGEPHGIADFLPPRWNAEHVFEDVRAGDKFFFVVEILMDDGHGLLGIFAPDRNRLRDVTEDIFPRVAYAALLLFGRGGRPERFIEHQRLAVRLTFRRFAPQLQAAAFEFLDVDTF